MKTLKVIAALGLGVLVSACSNMPDIASRNAPFETTAAPPYQQPSQELAFATTVAAKDMRIARIDITVPRSLDVTEANVYYPRADIVWRDDPIGDRHEQVKAIFEAAAFNGTKDMIGAQAVIVDLRVKRFHSLSERTRASIGGVHNMHFYMTVFDAATGEVLSKTREIEANLPAYGGNEAIAAERRGQTQKVRVTGYLAQVIRRELEPRPDARAS
jgi:hypothetical protein